MGKAAFIGCLLLIGWSPLLTPSQSPDNSESLEDKINWLSWEEALKKQEEEPRKIIVDIFTDWCIWCKRMEATFNDKNIAQYINENYYAIKFNAEQKEDISFKGKTYSFVNSGKKGYHELAAEITQGRLGYPSIVFMDESFEVIQAINGYKESSEFEMIITYFGDDFHMKMPWERYIRQFQAAKE